MVFIIQTPNQKELYLVELERGKNKQKAVEKCVQHLKAILIGSANKVFNFNKGYRVLFIFEEASLMKSTLQQLQTNLLFDNLTEYFLFKFWDDIVVDSFFSNWVTLTGEERKMFY